MNKTIGFIGCGNMGGALARAAARGTDPRHIVLHNRSAAKAEALAAELGARTGTLAEAAGCGYIFLGVKPQGLAELAEELRPLLVERAARQERFVLVSMLAAVTVDKLKALLGDAPVIRLMPNTPVGVGEGLVLYCAQGTEPEELAEFLETMAGAGMFCPLEEKLIDAGSAVSGCGPAYAFMFIEALADGGVRCGLKRADAQRFAAQMLLGSAKLLLESGRHPGELKDSVCSPGGSTIAGVAALEDGAVRAAAADAVVSAYRRTLEMGK